MFTILYYPYMECVNCQNFIWSDSDKTVKYDEEDCSGKHEECPKKLNSNKGDAWK